MPNEQERNAYTAVKLLLTWMIKECEQLENVPREMWKEMERAMRVEDGEKLSMNLDLEMPLRNGLFDFREEYQRLFRSQHQKLRDVDI